MPALRFIACAIAVAVVWVPARAGAQPALKIFDAHLHYNQEPNPYYPLDRVLEVFRGNGVAGILANSRPNKEHPSARRCQGTGALGGAVHPSVSHPRRRAELVERSCDLICSRPNTNAAISVASGFHIYGNAAQGALVKRVVDFAAGRDLYLLAHCDGRRCSFCSGITPRPDHLGPYRLFDVAGARKRAARDPSALMGELSYRSGITASDGKLASNGAALLVIPTVSLLGSDTWINERWFGYHTIIRPYRGWLAQLPRNRPSALPTAATVRRQVE
jgi:hypothetical protein